MKKTKKTKILYYPVQEGRAMSPTEKILEAPSIEELFVKFEIINYLLRKTDGASFIEFMKRETEEKQITWYNSLTQQQRFDLYYNGKWNNGKYFVDLKEIINE